MNTLLKGIYDGCSHDEEGDASADLPKISFALAGARNALEVHAEIGGEEGQGQKDDGDAGEDEDGAVVGLGEDGDFVLLDGAELVVLQRFGKTLGEGSRRPVG